MQRPLSKSLLKDGSWIRKPEEEEEDVDRDPNFALNILKHGGKSTTTTKTTRDGKTTETTTTTTTTNLKSPVLKSPTKTETFNEKVLKASNRGQYSPFPSTKSTKVTETTVTTSKDTEEKLYDTLISKSIKDDIPPIDSKTTVTTTETVLVKSSPSTDAQDKLYDSPTPSYTKDNYSLSDSKTTISSTETVTVRSSTNGDVKTTNTTRTSSTAEDELYDTLLPRGITSGLDSPISSGTSSIKRREYITVESSRSLESSDLPSPSSTRRTTSYSSYTDDLPSTRTTSYTVSTKTSDTYDVDNKNYTYTKPDSSYEYTSITSPSSYSSTTYRSSSRSNDNPSDTIYSKSSKSLYTSSDRTMHEKDLCTVCRKPFTDEAKMVLDEMKINCHASCFKCEVCNSTLAHLKAGDSMWIYRQMVHCENCFEVTRERWRH